MKGEGCTFHLVIYENGQVKKFHLFDREIYHIEIGLGVYGGGVPPVYKLYRYVPPRRVWFLSHFGLKTGIDFYHYLILNRVWLSREPRERTNVFVFSTPNE